jgi:hypothetical protein
VVNASGEVGQRQMRPTSILALIGGVPRPLRLVIEEGPLAGRLGWNLRLLVDEMIVHELRPNRLIANPARACSGS